MKPFAFQAMVAQLALFTGGEGFHHHHHGFPRSPKFSVRPGEIDPSWPIIQLLTRMKLARPYRTIEEIGYSRLVRRGERQT